MEGLRFGFVVGVMTAIPMAYGTYAMIAISVPHGSELVHCGLIECMLLGRGCRTCLQAENRLSGFILYCGCGAVLHRSRDAVSRALCLRRDGTKGEAGGISVSRENWQSSESG